MSRFSDLTIVIESPKGTSKVFRRESSGDPAWAQYPLSGVTYPVDYGYIEGFIAEDRMGLDIFVGSGDVFGYFKMRRVDVTEETKVFARVSRMEMELILKTFEPVLVEWKTMSEEQFMTEIVQFRV